MMFNNYVIDSFSRNFYNIKNDQIFLNDLNKSYCILEENLKNIYIDIQNKNLNSKNTLVLLEYAGFGDTFHTKLIIQHLQKQYKNIVWITLENIKNLYKEHIDLHIYDNKIKNILRNPNAKICQDYSNLISELFFTVFKQYENKKDISNSIIFSHIHNYNKPFWWHYYNMFNINRDFSIKHNIRHSKNFEHNLNKEIICFEHNSITYAPFSDFHKYEKIVNNLSSFYDIVLLGGKEDPYLPNVAIDYRGKNFYDTFSVIKKSKFFIGRNSGNQLLTVFLDDLPVIEIDTPDNCFIDCKYKKNVFKAYSIEQIFNLIGTLK